IVRISHLIEHEKDGIRPAHPLPQHLVEVGLFERVDLQGRPLMDRTRQYPVELRPRHDFRLQPRLFPQKAGEPPTERALGLHRQDDAAAAPPGVRECRQDRMGAVKPLAGEAALTSAAAGGTFAAPGGLAFAHVATYYRLRSRSATAPTDRFHKG